MNLMKRVKALSFGVNKFCDSGLQSLAIARVRCEMRDSSGAELTRCYFPSVHTHCSWCVPLPRGMTCSAPLC